MTQPETDAALGFVAEVAVTWQGDAVLTVREDEHAERRLWTIAVADDAGLGWTTETLRRCARYVLPGSAGETLYGFTSRAAADAAALLCTSPLAMTLDRTTYAHLGEPVGPYSHGVRVRGGALLYLSGLTAVGTAAEHGTPAEQADAALAQIAAIAEAEGTTLASLVKVTIYVTSLDNLDGIRDVLARHYGDAPPASSLVQVAGLFAPHVAVEIEAVLATP